MGTDLSAMTNRAPDVYLIAILDPTRAVRAEEHPEGEECDENGQPGPRGAERDDDARGEHRADEQEDQALVHAPILPAG